MDHTVAPPERLSAQDALRARNGELASQLRAAAMEGDKPRLTCALSELLHFKRLTSERKIALHALTELIDSLRCVAMTDQLTEGATGQPRPGATAGAGRVGDLPQPALRGTAQEQGGASRNSDTASLRALLRFTTRPPFPGG